MNNGSEQIRLNVLTDTPLPEETGSVLPAGAAVLPSSARPERGYVWFIDPAARLDGEALRTVLAAAGEADAVLFDGFGFCKPVYGRMLKAASVREKAYGADTGAALLARMCEADAFCAHPALMLVKAELLAKNAVAAPADDEGGAYAFAASVLLAAERAVHVNAVVLSRPLGKELPFSAASVRSLLTGAAALLTVGAQGTAEDALADLSARLMCCAARAARDLPPKEVGAAMAGASASARALWRGAVRQCIASEAETTDLAVALSDARTEAFTAQAENERMMRSVFGRLYTKREADRARSSARKAEPLVSVIMPVYNGEAFLRETLDSVLTQDLRELELLAVDDGSTDGTAAILAEYAAKDPRVRVLKGGHAGVSRARNTALDAARGRWLYCLDSDDLLRPGALRLMEDTAEKRGAQVLMLNGANFAEGRAMNTVERLQYRCIENIGRVVTGRGLLLRLLRRKQYYPGPMQFFFRRSLIEEKHLRFREGIIYEDQLFFGSLLLLAQKVSLENCIVYDRRLHPGSIVSGSDVLPRFRGLFIDYAELSACLRSIPDQAQAALITPLIREHLLTATCRWGAHLTDAELEASLQDDSEELRRLFREEALPLLAEYRARGNLTF